MSRERLARVVDHGTPARGQLAITLGGDLIALRGRAIASVSNRITTRSSPRAPRVGPTAQPGGAVAQFTRVVVHGCVATPNQITIARCLVHGSGGAVPIRQRLFGVGSRLVAVRPRLIRIRKRLIPRGERVIPPDGRQRVSERILLSLGLPARGTGGRIA